MSALHFGLSRGSQSFCPTAKRAAKMASSRDLCKSDADWVAYAIKHDINLPSETEPVRFEDIRPAPFDPIQSRQAEHTTQQQWSRDHPLSSVGYTSRELTVQVRDGAQIPVKVSWPQQVKASTDIDKSKGSTIPAATPLPMLFVTHGGGWIQGTHAGEERWLLWPLYEAYDMVVVSVEYRLAPEQKFPRWIDDSWDVLRHLLTNPEDFVADSKLTPDLRNIILAGSSTGACIAAVLSQRCRDEGIAVGGVILNVPVLCDYRHLPLDKLRELNDGRSMSYEQCTDTLLSAGAMKAVWNIAIDEETSRDVLSRTLVSPLHGKLQGLPPHLLFVAGQDPLRDEAILYARRLADSGVSVELTTYPGLPHTFGEMHELEATRKFWVGLRQAVREFKCFKEQHIGDERST